MVAHKFGKINLRPATKNNDIRKFALYDHVSGKNTKRLSGQPLLNEEAENRLIERINCLCLVGDPLTTCDIIRWAFL